MRPACRLNSDRLFRYVLLYIFGGFYLDLDIECHKPMDALRAYPFIMPQTRPVGFSNDFLASTAGESLALSCNDWTTSCASFIVFWADM